MTKVLKSLFVPASVPIQSIMENYIYVSDRDEQEIEAFRSYIHDLTKRFSVFVLTGMLLLTLITWPSNYLYLTDKELLDAYWNWRWITLIGITIPLVFRLIIGWFDRHFLKMIVIGSVVEISVTGYLFGSVVSYGEPWFYTVYVLPIITTLLPLGLLLRTSLSIIYPASYVIGFSLPQDGGLWSLSYPGITFELVSAVVLISIMIGHFNFVMLRKNYFQSKDLEEEREKSDQLLYNTLPESVAKRLKREEDISERFDEVTVLFADIVQFTPLADELPPDEVVSILDDMFSSFDDVVNDHGLEKIKTIGDEYFVAAGVPDPVNNHAFKMAKLAFDLKDTVKNYTRHDGNPFQLRCGMNTGPIVAGIIGKEKFVYDVWGDTVNIGSRMESQGEPGKIQVTPTTKTSIEEQNEDGHFEFEGREGINVKGKGTMETFFLTRHV